MTRLHTFTTDPFTTAAGYRAARAALRQQVATAFNIHPDRFQLAAGSVKLERHANGDRWLTLNTDAAAHQADDVARRPGTYRLRLLALHPS